MTAAEGTGDQSGPAAPPDNPDALVEEINRTREELGNTVEALASKVDVKARAQQKATEVSGQLKSKVRDVTEGLSGKAGQLKGEVSDRTAGARQAVTENGKTVLGSGQPATKTIASRAAQAGATAQSAATQAVATVQAAANQAGTSAKAAATQAWAATPEPAQQRARRAAATVNQHRVPFAAAAAAGALVLAGWLVVRGRRR
jgi:gas vesicle protein